MYSFVLTIHFFSCNINKKQWPLLSDLFLKSKPTDGVVFWSAIR